MRLRWLKILLIGILAVFALLATAVFTVTRTETGAGWVLGIAQDQLGGLEIGGYSGSIHGGLELERIGFSAPSFVLYADDLRVAVRTDWFPFVLRIEWLEAEGLDYQLQSTEETPESEPLPESLELPIRLELPRVRISGIHLMDEEGTELYTVTSLSASASVFREVQLHELKLEVEQGTAGMDGTVGLQNPFPIALALWAEVEAPLEGEAEPLLVDLAVNANGSVSGLDLEFSGEADPPRFAAHSFKVQSRVSLAGMETELFEISGPDLEASGSSGVDWETSRAWLENVSIAIPGTGLSANVRLATDMEASELEGEVSWTGLTWPLRTEAPEWVSPRGNISLSGSFDNWSAAGQVEARAAGYPAGVVRFEADGDRGGANATVTEMTMLGGKLRGDGSYRWDDGGAFSAEISLEDLATESLLPDYPAVLSGQLAASGRMDPLNVSLDVKRLDGEALGKPVAASGRIEIAGDIITADEFNIVSGTSRVVVNGFPDEQNGLAFNASIMDLGDFVPGSRGSVMAAGSLYLRSGWPALRLDASGNEVGWHDYHVASFTLNGNNLDSSGAGNAFDLSVSDVRVGDAVIEQADTRLELGADSQTLSLQVISGVKELNMELAGAIVQPDAALDDWEWSGRLQNLHAVLSEKDRISLQEPAPVTVSARTASLEGACMEGSRGASICMQADWSTSAGAKLVTRVGEFKLDTLNELLGMDLLLSQMFSGDLQLQFPPGGKPSGSADFLISAGSISYVDDPEPILETGDGALAFTLTNGRLTSGVLDIPITGQGVIDIDYHIPDVTEGLDAELAGTLLVDLADLDVLTIFLPRADQVSGTMRADLEMSGTLGQPYFKGRFDLRDGLLANRASGFRLEDIELSGNLAGNRETRLTGGFRAAEGIGELTALIDIRDIQRPLFELGVSGEQLKLFNSEDLVIVIDTDLNVAVEPGAVNIDGAVHVPRALIAPALIPEEVINESPDLVITAGRPSGETTEQEEEQPVAILGDLEFSLGDDVTLDLTVAELDLAGKVDFSWQGAPLPNADGSFNLEGEVVAFGQRLEIAQGDIGFPGGPADNPHLNIRAEREIFGNSEVRRAGLLVAGTVKRPVVEPYTDPMTNRDRAQTLLVTGSDFNMERGVGAVDIGTYIAPRIFLSYGVGVFDDSNILSVRYDLGRGWGIKATSGERQTGLDISYTIER